MAKKSEYLIVGNGKLAKHIACYFSQKKIPFKQWSRSGKVGPEKLLRSSEKILLAISDTSIEPFINKWKPEAGKGKIFIHFSGALSLPQAESAHPLMTFSNNLYSAEFYEQIPFVTEKGKLKFTILFPELKNPHFEIEPGKKPLYHALCSIGGNLPVILWQYFQKEMEKNFGLPKNALLPYLNKILENFSLEENSLTGPLARGDFSTIEKHRLALNNSKILNVYNSFVDFYLSNDLMGSVK